MIRSNVEGGGDVRDMIIPISEYVARPGIRDRAERLSRPDRLQATKDIQSVATSAADRRLAEAKGHHSETSGNHPSSVRPPSIARHSAKNGTSSGSALKDRAKLHINPETPSVSQYGGVESGVSDSASELPSGLSIGGGGSSLLGMRAIRGAPLISGFEASSIANSRGFGIYNGLPTGAGQYARRRERNFRWRSSILAVWHR